MLNKEIDELRYLDYSDSEILDFFLCLPNILEVEKSMREDIQTGLEAKQNYKKGDIK
jgi:hypothetical protein